MNNKDDAVDVNDDVEDTIEVPENRIKKYKIDRDRHFTKRREGRLRLLPTWNFKSQDGGRESQWTRGFHRE